MPGAPDGAADGSAPCGRARQAALRSRRRRDRLGIARDWGSIRKGGIGWSGLEMEEAVAAWRLISLFDGGRVDLDVKSGDMFATRSRILIINCQGPTCRNPLFVVDD
jgi:hypothetical protein